MSGSTGYGINGIIGIGNERGGIGLVAETGKFNMTNLDAEIIAVLEKPEARNRKPDNVFDDVNAAARMLVANVLRRLICSQAEDYQRARAILDAAELPEEARKIVEEEPAIVATLYACVYDQHGQLRRDDRGTPLSKNFVESKILNMKENPYKGEGAMLLRGLFLDLRTKMGGKNEYRKACRQIFHELRRPALAPEDEQIADVEAA
jgi:hypothetical protein